MMNTLQIWWQQRPVREQRLLKIGLPMILLLVLVLLLNQRESSITRPVSSPAVSQSGLEQQNQQQQLLRELAETSGLKLLQLQIHGDLLTLNAEAPSHQAVQRFLQRAGELGWYWRNVQLQGMPVRVQLELVNLQ